MVLSVQSPNSPLVPQDSTAENIAATDQFTQQSWRHLQAELYEGVGVYQWFEHQVSQTPEQLALIGQGQSLTYQVLNQKANQLAHYLRQQGVGPDVLVAVTLERSLEMVIAFLGILKAGGAYVPIDPAYPSARRDYLLKDAQASLILTQTSLAKTLSSQGSQIICLDTDWAEIAVHPTDNLAPVTTPENLAYVIYTSGSTGNPKGVMIPHRGLMNHCAAMANVFELTPQDRVLQFSSMSFDIIIEELYPALVTGATLVLRPEQIASSIRAFLSFVAEAQITVINLPTAFWHELVRGLSQPDMSLSSRVRLTIVGGEKASCTAYGQWQSLVGEHVRWLNTYGPTETTVSATLYDPKAASYRPDQGELPIGQALSNVKTYVLDEQLQPVSMGCTGELHIGGPGVAKGYLNLPEKTAERFIRDPFNDNPQARLYKTGDRVRYQPEGDLEFIGRVDFQVKIRGFRIELGEIEACLEQHEAIAQTVVMAREETPGAKKLVAYVVLKTAWQSSPPDFKTYVQSKLPEYMVPSSFVAMETLPLTTNGKVDRKALPAPVMDRTGQRVPPSNELERQLVEIWQTILDIQPLGVTDNFFELGGHSLLVARLFDALERQLNCTVPLTVIFEAPTIQQLAQVLGRSMSSSGVSSLGAADVKSLNLKSLSLLKAGQNRAPLFLIHDADGDTSPYLNLARRLKTQRSIYGVGPLSQPGIPMIHTDLPTLAADYLSQLRQIQPQGPYFLGGLCAGGVIAFEMALQLQRQGEEVALLALMEAPDVEAVERSNGLDQRRDGLLHSVNKTGGQPLHKRGWQVSRLLVQKSWSFSRYLLRSQYQTLSDNLRCRLFRWCMDHQWSMPSGLKNLSVRTLYLFAEKTYRPQGQLQYPMLLFKATEGQGADQPYHEIYVDIALGWRKRMTAPVTIHSLPGGHSTMLAEPHVEVMADILDEALMAISDSVDRSMKDPAVDPAIRQTARLGSA